jgi:hypothetical protein
MKKNGFFSWTMRRFERWVLSIVAPDISFLLVHIARELLRTRHPSGSRLMCLSHWLNARPWTIAVPRKSSVPCRVQLINDKFYGC